MSDPQIKKMALQLSLKEKEVQATISLLDSGASLPFIARYRKEATGNLDEVAIAAIRESLFRLRRLEERRESIIESLAKRSLLTDDLQERLLGADTLESMEDIYLPFRIRRKTRATAARERGLEPLARTIFAQDNVDWDPEEEALVFVNPEKGVSSAEQALSGARDIMAEWMSEDGRARQRMRSLYQSQGIIRSAGAAGKEEDAAKIQRLSGPVRAHLPVAPAQHPGHAQRSEIRSPEPAYSPAGASGTGDFRGAFHKRRWPAGPTGQAGGYGQLSSAAGPIYGK